MQHYSKLVQIHALTSLFQIKTDESPHTYIIITPLRSHYIYHSDMFQHSKGHPQGVRLTHFSREVQQNELQDVNSGIQIKHTYKLGHRDNY